MEQDDQGLDDEPTQEFWESWKEDQQQNYHLLRECISRHADKTLQLLHNEKPPSYLQDRMLPLLSSYVLRCKIESYMLVTVSIVVATKAITTVLHGFRQISLSSPGGWVAFRHKYFPLISMGIAYRYYFPININIDFALSKKEQQTLLRNHVNEFGNLLKTHHAKYSIQLTVTQ